MLGPHSPEQHIRTLWSASPLLACFGGARRVGFLEQQFSTPILVKACAQVRVQQKRMASFVWKGEVCLVLITFTALFIDSQPRVNALVRLSLSTRFYPLFSSSDGEV